MPDITTELNNIMNARYGKDVRKSIHDGIKKVNDIVDDTGYSELIDIRVGADGTAYDSAGEAVREQVFAMNKLNAFITPIVTIGESAYKSWKYSYSDSTYKLTPNEDYVLSKGVFGYFRSIEKSMHVRKIVSDPDDTSADVFLFNEEISLSESSSPSNHFFAIVGNQTSKKVMFEDLELAYKNNHYIFAICYHSIILTGANQRLFDALDAHNSYLKDNISADISADIDLIPKLNSELLDIRVGADGTAYDSAGEAVRNNFQFLGYLDTSKDSHLVSNLDDIKKVGYYQIYVKSIESSTIEHIPDLFDGREYVGTLMSFPYTPYQSVRYGSQCIIGRSKDDVRMAYRGLISSGWSKWVINDDNKKNNPVPALMPLSSKIFRRVGCIGDSYTSGHIDLNEEFVAAPNNPNYAWPHYMEQLTGNTWTNFGVSGSSTKSWMNGKAKLSDVQKEGNKCQAYVIGLMINDASNVHPNRVPCGKYTDIGTDADTYYAYYYKLIQELIKVNPKAKMFCNTCPKTSTSYTQYNQAVRDIVTYCHDEHGQNVYLCDLADETKYYNELYYKNSIFEADMVMGHYTAIGYEYMAECYLRVMSDTINNNIKEFQDVFSIPYDEPVS